MADKTEPLKRTAEEAERDRIALENAQEQFGKKSHVGMKVLIHVVCIILALLSILPFWIMIVNATRSTNEIQQTAISLIPSKFLMNNFKILTGKSFQPMVGFSVGTTSLNIPHLTATEAIKLADRNMYIDKTAKKAELNKEA